MVVTSAQLSDQLQTAGLLREDHVRSCCESMGTELNSVAPENLAKQFVRRGWLTPFQAQVAFNGKTSSLVMGSYVLLEKLGEGGMGQVFKARHKTMKREVAIKTISPSVVKNKASLRRFQRECEVVAKLCHPNIVTAHDAGECDGRHYLVMEYIKGSDLAAVVRTSGPLTVARAVECTLQTALGLAYAHAHGVVHRDVKPANLLQEESGTIKILDMGLARFEECGIDHAALAGLTGTDVLIGTLDFMSPEQAIDPKTADAKSDIYSLGCTMYFLMTGRPIFEQDTFVKRLLSHQNSAIPVLPSGDPGLQEIFERMVAKKAAQRYEETSQLVVALQQWLDERRNNGTLQAICETAVQPISGPAAPPKISSTTEPQRMRKRRQSVSKPVRVPSAPEIAQCDTKFSVFGTVKASASDKRLTTPDVPLSIDWSIVDSAANSGVSEWAQVTLAVENEFSATKPGESVISPCRRSGRPQQISGPTFAGTGSRLKSWLICGSLGGGAVILLLLAVFAFRVQTPPGMIVIQTDQPEIVGALITVDEQHKVTLSAGTKQESMEFKVDEREHRLKVTKDGFRTLTHKFSVKAGASQTITVRLEPIGVHSVAP